MFVSLVSGSLITKDKTMLMTQHEMKKLIDQINNHFEGTFQRLADLETKMEELSNAKVQGSKASTGGRKRVQQAKANTKSSD